MYLSPAVRTIRDDPTDGATAALAVRTPDGDAAATVEEVVAAADGTVESVTRFDTVRARLPEPAVAALLDSLPESVEAVETTTTVADEHGAEE